jgi:hypothetical protein
MKVDMSPRAIENRLKLVGELTKACLLLDRNKLKNNNEVKSGMKPQLTKA